MIGGSQERQGVRHAALKVCEGRKWHLHKLHDEKGQFAIIRPTGGKLSRFKYRQKGKVQQLSLGTYPEVSLKDARQRRDEARQLLAEGKDPGAEKKRAKLEEAISAGNTFKALHTRPIADIEPIELLAELRKVENVGHHEAARQVRAFGQGPDHAQGDASSGHRRSG
jgi:Arm DNA-binding domain